MEFFITHSLSKTGSGNQALNHIKILDRILFPINLPGPLKNGEKWKLMREIPSKMLEQERVRVDSKLLQGSVKLMCEYGSF